jgi:sarcosine oxidase
VMFSHDRRRLTRRAVLQGITRCVGASALLSGVPRAGSASVTAPDGEARAGAGTAKWDVAVIGAGVFGAWTAWQLRREGHRVLLLDAWGPAHARASSGGESRVTRTAYGRDEVYARMAWESLADWAWLSERSGLPILHRIGVLFFFQRIEAYVSETLEVHRRLKLPTQSLERAELARRFPQIAWEGVEIGLYEPQLGALMARRAVQTLVAEYVRAGGEYRVAFVEPSPSAGGRLSGLRTSSDESIVADKYVFACGPWLPKVFPGILATRIFPTRQEVFFFAPEAGDTRFSPGRLPVWADFNGGDIVYGMPDLEARGFKIAQDRHGPAIDPDVGDREISATGLAEVRRYLQRRFPALAARPLVESRVCQYENSSNGDFLIDRHPTLENVWLVGGGSGHGFKHGPAVGRYAAQLVDGVLKNVESRFSLATKASIQNREVH